MIEQIYNNDIKKISNSSEKEELDRKENLDLFFASGLPNKKEENWKFTDFNKILSENFKNIKNNDFIPDLKIELINDFEHNYIVLVNGCFKSSDMKFEEKEKVKIEKFNSYEEIKYQSANNLNYLNKALSLGGFNLEIEENYKCKKPIVVYNYFTSNLDNKIINNSNKIKLNENSELNLMEYNVCEKSKFIKNNRHILFFVL